MFDNLEDITGFGEAFTPYAGRRADGVWLAGTVSIQFLKDHFGDCTKASEMKAATESEGLKRFFDYLASEGMILM